MVISDYNKGFLTQFDILNISKNNSCVLLDTKKPLGSWADYCTFIKINDYEYENSKSYIKPNNNIKDRIIHTKGDEGCFYQGENFPVPQKVEVKDTSGAGDSFMAALVVNYLKTKDIKDSINFANKCASEVVKHKGVTLI